MLDDLLVIMCGLFKITAICDALNLCIEIENRLLQKNGTNFMKHNTEEY